MNLLWTEQGDLWLGQPVYVELICACFTVNTSSRGANVYAVYFHTSSTVPGAPNRPIFPVAMARSLEADNNQTGTAALGRSLEPLF